MHGRMTVALAAVSLALIAPASAAADVMPPGDYTVKVGPGSLKFGELPPVSMSGLPPFQVTIAAQPVTTPLPVPYTVVIVPIPGITITTTIDTGEGTIDPATGVITSDLTFHAVLKAVPSPFLNVTGTCTYGAADNQIPMHLATTPDSVWKLPDRTFTVYDNAWVLPAPVCDDPTLQSLVTNAAGDTSAGHNSAAFVGTAARPEDAPPPEPPPPVLGGGGSSGGGSQPSGGGSTNPGGSNDPGTGTTSTPATEDAQPQAAKRQCAVPHLKGRTLVAAKRALRRAGCRVGKVTRRKSRKRAGTILGQGKRAGKKLARGTRVSLLVAARR